MSDLNSLVDVVKGWPNSSAVAASFRQKALVAPDISEGEIVAVENDGADMPVVDRLTSGLQQNTDASLVQPNVAWFVVQGIDQWDAATSDYMTCIKLGTGVIFKIPKVYEHNVGDQVYAVAGEIRNQPAWAHTTVQIGVTGVFYTTDKQVVGQVVEVDAVNGWILVQA